MVTARTAALALTWLVGLARAGTGAWFLARPEGPERNWVAKEIPETRYLVRTVGGRDLAIGLGAVAAVASGRPALPWTLASLGSDLVDASMGGLMLEGRPRRSSLVYALGFGALGAVASLLLVLSDSKR